MTGHSCTLLDPIILRDNLKCVYADVLDILHNISDHHAANAMTDCPKRKSTTFVQGPIYVPALYEKFDNMIISFLKNSETVG